MRGRVDVFVVFRDHVDTFEEDGFHHLLPWPQRERIVRQWTEISIENEGGPPILSDGRRRVVYQLGHVYPSYFDRSGGATHRAGQVPRFAPHGSSNRGERFSLITS
jgi:hypothetical protein